MLRGREEQHQIRIPALEVKVLPRQPVDLGRLVLSKLNLLTTAATIHWITLAVVSKFSFSESPRSARSAL